VFLPSLEKEKPQVGYELDNPWKIVLCVEKIVTFGEPWHCGAKKMERDKEINEENRKIRYLRYLVDFSILSIQEGDLSFEEAMKVVEDAKQAACGLFPGKEETFELVYRPRFNRAIRQRFHLEAQRS